MSDSKKKIAIIGGGASGMTAAITASRGNAIVTVFEINSVPGKKICATGNGKCNFTNDLLNVTRYRGGNTEFAKTAVSRFGVSETLKFFEEIGITPKKKGEYVYPNSEEAKSVQKALMLTMESLGVETVFEKVSEIKRTEKGFIVNNRVFDKVIIACGSPAGLKKDSGFNGYDLVKSLGHRVTPVFPALVQLRFTDKYSKTLSGVRHEGLITLFSDGKEMASDYGELLFTDYGISGIPTMQISRFAGECLEKKRDVKISIDLFKDLSEKELEAELKKRMSLNRTAEDCLTGLLNHKLNYVLLLKLNIDPEAHASKAFKKDSAEKLASLMKHLEFHITETNPFESAQVAAGGADLSEIDPETMQSKKVPGLYFAGEITDVDGPCGGYNLQWAWTSGYIAGDCAAKG